MRKHPYTVKEIWDTVNKKLSEKNVLPKILDYGLLDNEDVQIKSYEWDLIGIVNFGGSEGIYLDLYIKGETGNGKDKISVGTYKTLEEDLDAFKAMGDLNAEFVFALRDLVNHNLDDFTWTGYDISMEKNGEIRPVYTVASQERAKEMADKLAKHEVVTKVIIRDNATRKETIYEPRDGRLQELLEGQAS